MRDRDYYRGMTDGGLLVLAREQGIDPEMAVVLAERLEFATRGYGDPYVPRSESRGGRYFFNNRSEHA